jgi:L-aspartate oxidase
MSGSDLLVVGAGAAGLIAALSASALGAQVTLLTAAASSLDAGSSPRAQGGIAAALGPDDSPARHAADTLAVGAALNDPAAVDTLVAEGQLAVEQLLADGVPFEIADGSGTPELGLEAGHSRHRIVHAGAGATGRVLSQALAARVRGDPRIDLLPDTSADELILDHGRVAGVRAARERFLGHAVVLASGGFAALWARTTNHPTNRGQGLSLAFRAGASLADLEFVQFHPTALDLPGQAAFLLSEALRGEGARLVDARGREVVDPLLPRDVVARALHHHRLTLGPVYLSLAHLDPERICRRFASLAHVLGELGLDLARDPLPVAPAAHYCMGGIRTDLFGRTDVAGLYAAGEVACTGAQGANRLASNSLLECLVFGRRAAQTALDDADRAHASWTTGPLPSADALPPSVSTDDRQPLAERLDRELAVERDASGLTRLLTGLPDPDWLASSAEPLLAALVGRAAWLRHESRGAHFRRDAPDTDPTWRGRIHWRAGAPPGFESLDATTWSKTAPMP